MIALNQVLTERWASGEHVGAARPSMQVRVRRAYLQRYRRADGVWTARLEVKDGDDWLVLPGVNRCALEQSFDSNGITTCTLELANVAYPDEAGGAYHRVERGWFSPWRAYTTGQVPGLGLAPNEWEQTLAMAAEVEVLQGYGDQLVPTFRGLLDSIDAGARPDHLTLVARDFGQLLTDCHLFGWNIDPNLRDPIHFDGRDDVAALTQGTEDEREDAANRLAKWVIVDDLSEVVTTVLNWAGLPDHTVKRVGTSLKDATAFGRTEYLIDVIRKAQDVCGYTFFVGEPRTGFPLGEPIFRRSNAATVPAPVLELRDDQLLTGLTWQRSDEALAGIIRVRGKALSKRRGGTMLGSDRVRRVMGVYRPPWHRSERDARVIRHVVHHEPLYKTEQECLVAAQMIALQEALAAVSANVQIPAHPGLQLDDIISLRDRATSIASRAWIASKQSTFEQGQSTTFTQTLGVALLDTPDVTGVVEDLHGSLVGTG